MHQERVRVQHQRALAAGGGRVEIPDALGMKLPNAGREWPWQWVLSATRHDEERVTGQGRRHHRHVPVAQKAPRHAMLASGMAKRPTCQAFRHSSTTRLLESGSDSWKVQGLLGRTNLATTRIHTHAQTRRPAGAQS
ncbi:MAG: tyrosine-type recombinase/integrase [Planctomycetes bacterium]|nr:tyrosine-type recombinase/integrase [Planctomycetota bacterium]